jgi:hypothetical protein
MEKATKTEQQEHEAQALDFFILNQTQSQVVTTSFTMFTLTQVLMQVDFWVSVSVLQLD